MLGRSEASRSHLPQNRAPRARSLLHRCLAVIAALLPFAAAHAHGNLAIRQAIGHADGTIILELEPDPTNQIKIAQLKLEDARTIPLRTVSLADQNAGSNSWLPAPDLVESPNTRPTHAIAFAPPDAVGQSIWLDDSRIAVVWLTPPIDPAGLATPIRAEALASAGFLSLLEPLKRSPSQRWRIDLALNNLSRPIPNPRDADSIPELLARSTELRWIAALGRLHEADPELASRVRAALICDIDFGGGRRIPVSIAAPEDERRLLADLLSPALSSEVLAARARDWLSALPVYRTWIIDAAGLGADAQGNPVASMGVANLRRQPLSVRLPNAAGDPSLSRQDIPPHTAMGIRAAVDPNLAPDTLVPLSPPGADLIDFHPERTLANWLSGRSTSNPPPIAARLDRTPDGTLRLYIEARPLGRDEPFRIILHHGLTADDRSAIIDAAGQTISGRPMVVRVVENQPGAWRAIVNIPDTWTEPRDGGNAILRLGIELARADGSSWTWPRPILPWQTTRPRAAFDLSKWDELPQPPIDPLRRPAPSQAADPVP